MRVPLPDREKFAVHAVLKNHTTNAQPANFIKKKIV